MRKRKPRVGDVVRYIPQLLEKSYGVESHGLVVAHNRPARILAGWNELINPYGKDEEYIVQFFDHPGHPEPVLPSAIELVDTEDVL